MKNLDGGWLRGSAIGFISQEPVLFASTILENIRYGQPSATDEEVRENTDDHSSFSYIFF